MDRNRVYKYFAIDGTNLFWRCYRGVGRGSDLETDHTVGQAIESGIRKVEKIKKEFGYGDSKVYFIFDNPDSKFNERKIISQGTYKQERHKKEVSNYFYKALNIFIDVLKIYSNDYRVVWSVSREADDLTLPLKEEIEPGRTKLMLFVSSDMDWARNIDLYCDWHDWNQLVLPDVFREKHGFNPSSDSIKMYKAIRGDRSDGIVPGIPYLPKTILLDIIASYNNIDDLLNGLNDKDYSDKWKEKIKNQAKDLRLNYELVDFYEIDGKLNDMIYESRRDNKQLQIWNDVLNMSFMPKKGKDNQEFFKKRKVRLM